MTDCEIDNNDTKLMQLSNDLNSYCVNESINSDNTDLVDLNKKCLNGGFNSDHIDHCRQRAPIENVWSTSGIF
jgi:hypothetical protein